MLNAMLGAQHPSGVWCTYNTPIAGQRIPSYVDLSFQTQGMSDSAVPRLSRVQRATRLRYHQRVGRVADARRVGGSTTTVQVKCS